MKPCGSRWSRKRLRNSSTGRVMSLLVGVCGVSPAEGDVAFLKGDESAVGDGDAVGVAAEIA